MATCIHVWGLQVVAAGTQGRVGYMSAVGWNIPRGVSHGLANYIAELAIDVLAVIDVVVTGKAVEGSETGFIRNLVKGYN